MLFIFTMWKAHARVILNHFKWILNDLAVIANNGSDKVGTTTRVGCWQNPSFGWKEQDIGITTDDVTSVNDDHESDDFRRSRLAWGIAQVILLNRPFFLTFFLSVLHCTDYTACFNYIDRTYLYTILFRCLFVIFFF